MDRRSVLLSLLGLSLWPAPVAAAQRKLVQRYPGTRGLPWLDLGGFPTPLTEAPELARAMGVGRLFVKRDDRAGARYGGSKLRKLELLLGDAEARGFRAVATQGGVSSNQTLATAFFAKQRGLAAHLFLLPERPSVQAREHLMAQAALGAEQRLVGTEAQATRAMARLPERAYPIPTGGSSAVGNAGFVAAGLELAAELSPDVVYLPLGTGGSAVGLAVGLDAAGAAADVVAVRTASPRYGTPALLRKAARETSALLHELDPMFPLYDRGPRLSVREGWVGKGYAEPTGSGRRARELARKHAGLELDLTYCAKALAALQADAPKLRDKTVVFWLSYDARKVETGNLTSADLPRALRGYARGA
ncbi:MAG: pyridoxal-phosphate dependent enzyme [Myxococcales bacterium]|nr:pyridoxal-phosphate dependent enzyme [Myxococcales bacterium]